MNTHRGRAPHLPYAPWLAAPALVAGLFLVIPLIAIAVRTPWADFWSLISTKESTDALLLSVRTCVVSTLVCALLGTPLAVVLARLPDSWWSRTLRTVATLPMMLPPVVAGLALLLTWGRNGLLGKHLSVVGIEIGFTTVAVIMAQTFVSMPFLVTSLEGAIRSRGFTYEEAAAALGASRTRTFFEVTLPVILPAFVSATALAFSRALGEFGATITFAGSMQGTTRTMPLAIYLQRESNTEQALALAIVLITLAIVVIMSANALASHLPGGRVSAHATDRPRGRVHEDLDVPSVTREYTALDIQSPASHGPDIVVRADVKSRGVSLDLTLPGGELTAVMGPNGAGKSTLLALIAGTLAPSSGSVSFPGNANPRVVVLQQNPLLFPHMSALTNVEFGLRCRGMARAEATARARHELAEVRCEDLSNRRPDHLSGGQAQRVAIARAMAVTPDVVLLDEPMAGLDEPSAIRVRQLLKERLAASGATAVLVTHDPVDANELATTTLVIRHGKVAA